ncbi:MAG: cyclic nucleotide-binding domain-containing protein [Gammaproteobacteria bacterium]|nr:cyclic nucleotide-binding domain-containing protein [Gammaproteobacteria bacterium]MDH5778391.1 cyclic nucleotide-binding domain-containing protein [Gammaproteobacteria bacterium]
MTKRASSLWSNLFRKRNPITDHIIDMWSTTPLFRDIPKREILQLVRDMPPRNYAPNEYIFHSGDQGAGAAIILSGKVHIRSGEVLLAELKEGDFFGEIALVLDVPRTADAIAVEDTELLFFLRPELEDWLSRSPYFAGRLGSNLAYVLAQRLIQANKSLEQAGQSSQI